MEREWPDIVVTYLGEPGRPDYVATCYYNNDTFKGLSDDPSHAADKCHQLLIEHGVLRDPTTFTSLIPSA